MTIKVVSALVFFISFSIFAQEYRNFIHVGSNQIDTDFHRSNSNSVTFFHFFTPQSPIGPYDQYDFFLDGSHVSGSYSELNNDFNEFGNMEYTNHWVSGRYQMGDWFGSGFYSKFTGGNDSSEHKYLSIGHQLSENTRVSTSADIMDDEDTEYTFVFEYYQPLENNGYLGFTLEVDEKIESRSVSADYFSPLSNGTYIAGRVSLNNIDSLDQQEFWSASADYYFNKAFSIGAYYNEMDQYQLSSRYFFTPQIALSISYLNDTAGDDVESIGATLSAQF